MLDRSGKLDEQFNVHREILLWMYKAHLYLNNL